ncbi:hypothetical protein BDF19DRAFT_259119 [Syncephalis fuscata]|nr:hypothetical protein BDF19DRAFT_259119 [Syncephalis fuscata]
MQVYRASNESIYEQQREFFNNVTQKCVVHLDSHDAQDTQKALFDNFTVLLTLDYSILEPVIDRIIPKTLSPPQESQEAARHFITELLQLQAKSRQFDTFMQQLLMAIQSWSPCNESILLTMPLLTSEFTTILESQVRKVPMSQIVQTITSIRQALMDQHLLIANQEGKKRRKLNRDTNTSSQQQIPNSITQLLAILLSRIINALPEQVLVDQSTDTYGLQHELKELGRSYIVPILEQQSRNTDHCISATYAIVALHGALMASYHDYWRLYASIESLKQLSIKGSARLTLAWVNALLVWISHWKIEHPLVKGNDSVEFDDGIIQRLVQQAISIDNCPYTTNEIEAQLAAISTWDGRLISLSNNTGASAQWLLLFSDWFSLICGQINDQQLDGLLTFLIRITQTASIHFKNDHHQPFVNLLDQLLKKSWFFEQSRLRDVFLPLLIRQLSSWAQVLNNESSSLSSMANETIDLLTTASDTITLSNIVNRLWTKESLSMLATLSKPLNRAINTVKVVDFIHQVDVWMSLLHQLPMAWYQCSVRDMIIRSILLLDRLFVALKSLIADSSSSQLIVKNHLVCRRLLSMVLQHYPDSHASLLEQPYLLIWMSETAITRQPLTDNLLQPLEEEKMQQTTKTIISSSLKWQLRRLRHEDTALVIVNEFMQPLLDWIKVHLKQVTNDWQSKKTAKQNLIIKVSLNEQALMMAEIILRALSTLSNISMNDATRSTKHTESIQQMMHSFNDLLNTGHQLTRQLLVNLQQTSNTVICNDNQETVTFINRLHKTVDLFDAVLVGGRALTKCGYTVSIDISTIPIQDLMNVCRQCLIPLQQTNKPIPLEVQITSICTALRLLEMILTNQANTTTSDDSRPAILLDLICQVIELTPLTPSSGQVHVYSRLHTSLDSFYIALATFSGQLLRDPFQDWITCILQELNSVIAGRFTNNAMQADKRCWSILTILCVISDPDHDGKKCTVPVLQ